MLKCMIIDDEQHAVDLLTQHVQQTPFLKLMYATTNPIEAIEIIQRENPDLVFLDIQMPEMSGLDVIKATRGMTNYILCTAFSEYALEGFEHDVIDYLLKPVTYARFIKGATKAMNYLSRNTAGSTQATADFIFIKTEFKGKLVRIDYKDIDYIEGMKNYVAFHTGKEKTLALLNMKFLEETLPNDRFIRVHNSYIVPLDRIKLIEGNELVLKNSNLRIPIGITHKENVLAALNIRK